MSGSELPVVAEGEAPGGERWFLRAGGSREDYYTMLGIVQPDGRREGGGGMGGPPLYPGSRHNSYAGRADGGPLRVVVRAHPRVRRLRLHSGTGEQCDLALAAADLAVGLTFFAAVLPWRGLDAIECFDAVGRPLTD